MKYLFCLFASLVLLYNCDSDNTSRVSTPSKTEFVLSDSAANLYKIVGEKHDTAMLLMTTLGKVQSVLRVKLQAAETSENEKDTILNLLTALKKADDGMMDWMHEFKSLELNEEDYKNMSEGQIMLYLKEEETKIEKVHLDMIESIKNGKSYLKI